MVHFAVVCRSRPSTLAYNDPCQVAFPNRGGNSPPARQFARRTAPVQAAVQGIMTTAPELHNTTYMNYTIKDAPVAALNSEHRTDESSQVFLADVQVSGLLMNLHIDIGLHVSILNEAAF